MSFSMFLAAAIGAASTAAAPAAEPPAVELPDPDQHNDQILEAFDDQFYKRRYAQALATAQSFRPLPGDKRAQAIAAAMRGAALLGLDRAKPSAEAFAEADRLARTEPYISLLLFDAGLLTDRFDVAADGIDRIVARFPDVARSLDWSHLRYFLTNEPKAQERRNQDRRIALARLGYGSDADYGDYIASDSIDFLVKRGDLAGAIELLPYIDEPAAIENMLVRRHYAALWPAIEQHAGPQLEKVRASSVATAQKAFEASPDDHDKLQLLVNALRHAGRLDEAIALRSRLPATREAFSTADEQLGWATNNVALALDEAGRAEEADQLFALLNEAPMKDDDWRVSMKINRLGLLVASGRYERALPLVEPTAKARGSPYARQLVRRLRYCTFSGLGRKEEAAKLLPELLDHAADAPSPTIDGLVCAGEIDQAEKLALASLAKESFHEDFVRQLQAQPLTSDDPSDWRGGWKTLRQRPAIAAAFNRLGRDMPAQFLPRSGAAASDTSFQK